MMKELNEKELQNIVGGLLTQEATTWIETNRAEIIRRAGSMGWLADIAFNYVSTCEEVYDIPKLKAELAKYGVDTQGL